MRYTYDKLIYFSTYKIKNTQLYLKNVKYNYCKRRELKENLFIPRRDRKSYT